MNEATRLYHRIRAMVLRDINAALAGRNTAGGATATVVEGHSHDDRYPLESELDAHIAATGVSVHGLGSISTQSAAGVNITGGTIAGITDLAVADGGTGASTASGARTNLGLVIGTNVQAWDADLDAIAALAKTEGNIIVGDGSTWVTESGSTARTSLGLGTGDSPQFTAINLGHASDTTIARVSAGLISVEGVIVTLNTATQTLTNKTLITPTIASFVNAQHNHSNAAGGGTIAHSVLIGIGANDHHNQSHVLASASGLGADHTVSGLTARQVLRATSATTAAFGAIEDADIPSTIVRTSRNLTAGNGLVGGGNLSADRTFDVAVSGLGLSVSSDSVNLSSSSNPGATASILATDSNGKLNLAYLGVNGLPGGSDRFNVTGHATLDSADFDGAVTIDDDLSVVYGGYYPLYVNVNTATPNNSNVGIMTNTPDAQFALDVAGPIRGEVLVGPHAIQLEDAEMIVHFDGPRPYETDFSGFSTGHMGQVGTESGGVIYRPGKFGKAVQVAEATTNLFTNPSFETGVTSWNVTGTATFVQSSDWFYYGSYSGRFQSTNVQRIETDVTANTSAGTQYTYTCFVRGSGTVYLRFFDNVSGNQAGSNIALSDDWQRVVLTKTFGAGSTSRYVHIVSTGAIDCYVDAVQLEQKSYATPYCDGSLGSGHSWSGTAHASTSSRTQAKAYWDIEYHAPFTAMGWFSYADALRAEASGGDRVHFGLYSGSNYIWVYLNDGDQPFAVTNVETRTINNTTDGLTWAAGTWHHWAFTLDASGNATLYIDGVEDGNATTFATMSGWTFDRLYLSTALASGHVYNGLTDDVALVGKVLSANEIRAIYESNAPVFAESSVFSFRAPTRSPVWVDEEGLWMRSYSGNATLGIYGGEATKSWGGLTLYDSDLAIGNSTAGYVHWHSGVDSDDTTYYGNPALQIAARLHVKDNSTFDGVISVGSSGGVYQGTGTFASPTTGLKIWNDSGVGRIGGYNGGTAQWYANTDGKFYAGAGALQIDSAGLSAYTGGGTVQQVYISSNGYFYAGNRTTGNLTDTNASFAVWPDGTIYMGDSGGNHLKFTVAAGLRAFGDVTLPNTGLHLLDADASHDLIIAPGSDLTANRTLTLMTGDADRTLTLTGNAILNQDTSTTGTPTWAQVNVDNLTLQEVSSTPSSPASGTEGRMYIKGDKLIIVFNDGGTVRYKYLDLTGTGVTWVHTTTAP